MLQVIQCGVSVIEFRGSKLPDLGKMPSGSCKSYNDVLAYLRRFTISSICTAIYNLEINALALAKMRI